MALDGPHNPTISNNSTINNLQFYFEDSDDESGQSGHVYNVRWGTSSSLSGVGEQCTTGNNKASYSGTFPSGNNLSAGTTYFAEFNFENSQAHQTSPWVVAAASATTDADIPDAPGAPTSSNVDDSNITLSWSAVTGATFYKLYWDEGTGDPTTLAGDFPANTNTSYTFGNEQSEDIEDSQIYSFRLRACNANGSSGFGGKLTQSTTFPAAPSITLSANTSTSNTISWTALDSNAGTIESKLYGEISDVTPDDLINTQTGTGSKSYIHSGLTPAGVYSYRLRMYVQYHNGAYVVGDVSTVTNLSQTPGNITSGAVTADDENSISVGWGTSAYATSYDLDYSLDNSNWNVLLNNQNQTSYNHTGLSANTQYYYRARGVNSAGDGNYVTQNTYTTPAPPSTFSYIGIPGNTYDGNVRFTVTEPVGATRIYIYASDGTQLAKSGDDWLAVDGSGTTTFDGDDWFYGSDEITLDNEYNEALSVGAIKFKSYSTNSGQQSSYSSTIQAYTLADNPAGFSADADAYDKVTMTWASPPGSALSETFYLEWGTDTNYGTTYTTSANATSHQVTGLNGSTTYYFKATTITDAGTGGFTTDSVATLAGPNPTNEALEMKYLGVMTGDASEGAAISMGTANGGATTEVSLRDFFAGALSSISGPSTLDMATTATYTAVFSNSGDAFNAQVATGKFAWSVTAYGSEGTNIGRTCQFTAAGPPSFGFTITCTFTPSFNDHMSVVQKTKVVTIGSG